MAGGVDQASVLVQLGVLDPTSLAVSGAESARKVLDPKLPSARCDHLA
jgi:carboxymethylenebutenolidase